jgi:hypothetical protein
MIVYCGGNACRISLSKEFPNYRKAIEEVFKLGGDNDIKILIDPTIGTKNHTKARSICANIIILELIKIE